MKDKEHLLNFGKPKETPGKMTKVVNTDKHDHQTLVGLSALNSVVSQTLLELEVIQLELKKIKLELKDVRNNCKCANETDRSRHYSRRTKRKTATENYITLNPCIGSDGLDWSAWKSPPPQELPHAQSFDTWQKCQQGQQSVSQSAIQGVVQPPVSQSAAIQGAGGDACIQSTVKLGAINNIMVCDTEAGNLKKALHADHARLNESLAEIQIMQKLADKCKSKPHPGCNHVAAIVSKDQNRKYYNGKPGITITMKKYELGSVDGYMEKKRLSSDEIELIADHMLKGLTYLWEIHGLGHCDMKPENVFLTLNQQRLLAVVGDFGTVAPLGQRQIHDGKPQTYADRRYLHETEQQNDPLPVTRNRDMFAYVLSVYDMVTGRSQPRQATYPDISSYDHAMWHGPTSSTVRKILQTATRGDRNLAKYYPMRSSLNGYGIMAQPTGFPMPMPAAGFPMPMPAAGFPMPMPAAGFPMLPMPAAGFPMLPMPAAGFS